MKILRSILIETKKFAQNEGIFDKRNSLPVNKSKSDGDH